MEVLKFNISKQDIDYINSILDKKEYQDELEDGLLYDISGPINEKYSIYIGLFNGQPPHIEVALFDSIGNLISNINPFSTMGQKFTFITFNGQDIAVNIVIE